MEFWELIGSLCGLIDESLKTQGSGGGVVALSSTDWFYRIILLDKLKNQSTPRRFERRALDRGWFAPLKCAGAHSAHVG